jgi:hypothetical protein
MASQEIGVRLQNMSVIGLGCVCKPGRDGKIARICGSERLRILLSWGEEELLTEGRAVHSHPLASHADELVLGLQFKKLEKQIEGRQALSKLNELMGNLQRDEVKRRRAMALAS